MAYDREKVINKLNDLLTRNYDAEQGFIEAGTHVNDVGLVKWFNENAATRNKFVHELKAHIIALDGEPNDGTSVLAEAHHFWIHLKSYFDVKDPVSMLNECHTGEEKALEDYQDILNEVNLPVATQQLLNRHMEEIRLNLRNIESLKGMYADATTA